MIIYQPCVFLSPSRMCQSKRHSTTAFQDHHGLTGNGPSKTVPTRINISYKSRTAKQEPVRPNSRNTQTLSHLTLLSPPLASLPSPKLSYGTRYRRANANAGPHADEEKEDANTRRISLDMLYSAQVGYYSKICEKFETAKPERRCWEKGEKEKKD
ncbi:hypothetical protein BDW02DRAFT_130752 [Decorospora gaudefroyi]|uniref:Uncharacterized protein n=1 Tax=Decorospora gaudefroyi TaxID=184978 RepID=A0A6A5KQD7_9PLEO|nr:hypothetical protein BDW02DRAFT_130752 [Decorospora gaudefroyi]